jgi:hypothetical protein
VNAITERQSSWRPAELLRELAAHVPTDTTMPADTLVGHLEHLVERAIAERCVALSPATPVGLRTRRDGRPITESALDHALTTPEILAQEVGIIDWATRRLRHEGRDNPDAAQRSTRSAPRRPSDPAGQPSQHETTRTPGVGRASVAIERSPKAANTARSPIAHKQSDAKRHHFVQWAIADSNRGPPPCEGGALTN